MALGIQALEPARLDDYLQFFDTVAFADNPEWAGCYCQCFLYRGPRDSWEVRTAAQNRAAAIDAIARAEATGLLAYDGARVVGWCQTGPVGAVPGLVAALGLETAPEATAWVVSCFLVAPAARRQGVARSLLDAVLERAQAAGASAVYAFPHPEEEDSAAGRFPGPLSLFEANGFLPVGRTRHRLVVKKSWGG